MKNNCILLILLTTIFVFIPVLIFAQDMGDPESVPIDGGLCILIAAGIGYGVKKSLKNKKENQSLI